MLTGYNAHGMYEGPPWYVQFDVAEELEVDEEDREYGNFDSFEEDGDGEPRDGEGYQVARRSLASIFGEAEVVEVDEAQADESLLVSSFPFLIKDHAIRAAVALALPDIRVSLHLHTGCIHRQSFDQDVAC